MKPDIKKYNPDETYIRALLKKSGYSQRGFAKEFGVSERMFRYYLDDNSYYKIGYALQYLLESLPHQAKDALKDENRNVLQAD